MCFDMGQESDTSILWTMVAFRPDVVICAAVIACQAYCVKASELSTTVETADEVQTCGHNAKF